jgi:voltage-gated potassium channel
MTKSKKPLLKRPPFGAAGSYLLISSLALYVIAFYVALYHQADLRRIAAGLFGVAAIGLAIDLVRRILHPKKQVEGRLLALDAIILFGTLASVLMAVKPMPAVEWEFRLVVCVLVFGRFSLLFIRWITPNRLIEMLLLTCSLLGVAGAGFYFLEPNVHTYADGLWLAFTTSTTVGYGDLIPSMPGSRILAVFIVLLGYALLSVVTAAISAIFIGESERQVEHDIRSEIRALHEEIRELRRELHHYVHSDKQLASKEQDLNANLSALADPTKQ